MKNFLAVFLGTAASFEKWKMLDEAKRKKTEALGMKAWGDWMEAHKSSIVVQGGPVGKTKRVGPQGVSDTKNNITGYLILKAESHEAAAKLFENHPHFTIFPGDAVEVMECLPIPTQPHS
ncbi:MAG TPA: hypothetical protein VGO37_19870 [Steroidobacteraceae bacterium]|jgi:hypothetical protein|nr:hypothetical protein [Steroidobacteraceae bacterium]